MSERSAWSVSPSDTHEAPPMNTEVSWRFQKLMRDAMCVSYYKYGKVAEGFPERVDAVESLKLRLKKYAQTGNAEYLVDVANFAMIEFMHPKHPDAFYKATDAEGSPGRIAVNREVYDRPMQFQNTDIEAGA